MVFGRKKKEEIVKVDAVVPQESTITEGVHIGKANSGSEDTSPQDRMAMLVELVGGMTDSEYKAQVLSILLEILEDKHGEQH